MKTSLTAQKVVAYALGVEIGLSILQFVYLKVFHHEVSFSDSYMQGAGFFIFQILGFFIFILLAQYVFKNSGDYIFRNALLMFFAGALVEILFYVSVQATYQGAFLYSVLDKAVSIAFGIIISFVSKPQMAEKI